MATKNDITGDEIKSKASSTAYESNYDKIFRTKREVEDDKAWDEAFNRVEEQMKRTSLADQAEYEEASLQEAEEFAKKRDYQYTVDSNWPFPNKEENDCGK
jgi:hypothetical protein